MSSEQLATVRALVATGLSVIPLPRPDAHHDGKRPTFPWSEYQQRLPTDAELEAWFKGEPKNLAVITGAVSGVVVVDADSAEAEAWCLNHLPHTPWRVRTARGLHLYYQHPGTKVANRARMEVPGGTVDLRGDGGYVVGPGSQHASGAAYRAEGDWSAPKTALPPLPLEALPAAPTRAYSAPVAPARVDTPERVLERARAYAAACDPAIEGQGGDQQTFMVCCRIARGFDLDEEQTLDVLREWNQRCRPPWDQGDLRAKVRSAMRNGDEPIGGRRDEPLPPGAPPVKLGGRVLGTGPGGGLHPDSPDAEREPVTGAAPTAGPRAWIEPARDFLAAEDPPEVFLVEELLPAGVLCLVHGEPRARKSWFALELAVAIASGTPAFGLARFSVREPAAVLYSSQEDARPRVRKRAQRFLRGRGLANPPGLYFSVHADINLEDEAWQQTMIQGCQERGIKAVILDPIRRYSPNVDKGPAEVRAVTQFLRRLAIEAECTVVIVHHDVKPGKDEDTRRRGHRASGGDWFAASEAPIHLEPAGRDASLVVPEDYKFSEDPKPFVFRIEGTSEAPTVRLVAESASAADAKALVDEEKVLAYLAEHPGVPTNALRKAVRLGKDTLPEVLASLERSGQVDSCAGPRKSTLWFLASDRGRFEGREEG